MNVLDIIKKYYKEDSELYHILIDHSTDVMNKALSIAEKHPELDIDKDFVREGAMLHDIGIFLTNAPSIQCFGDKPYICHGFLGSELLQEMGYPKHALVCERHTGTGLGLEDILSQNLPLPHRDMKPQSIEEKVICFADCFFSKTHLGTEKSISKIQSSLSKYGEPSINQFNEWCSIFL